MHPHSPIGGCPINGIRYTHHKNITPTIKPTITNSAPMILLFPDPKYALKIPATMLPNAKTNKNMLIKK